MFEKDRFSGSEEHMKRQIKALLLAAVLISIFSMAGCAGTEREETIDILEPVKISEEAEKESTDPQENLQEAHQEEPTEVQSAEPEKDPEITIRMVGDILLHDRVSEYALGEDGTYGFDVIFEALKEQIFEADLAIVNQEVIIGGEELGISGYPCFNAPFALGHDLVEAGFDVICHGTNHALDKGKRGLLSCLDFWEREYPEIAVLGIHGSPESQDEIYVYEQDGIKIAVLNYTYGTNGIALPQDMPYAVDLLQEEKVREQLARAEEMADFTVVCPHWGTEYVLEETKEQRRWAEIFLEEGVDLVLGTHPHVIEPVEMLVDEETGHEMLVYYSLGNFVNWTSSNGAGIANRMLGGMADVTVGPGEDGRIEIKEYSVTAVVTHLESRTDGVYTTLLSRYPQELSLENEIILQDPAFSADYLTEVCDRVWGELWK